MVLYGVSPWRVLEWVEGDSCCAQSATLANLLISQIWFARGSLFSNTPCQWSKYHTGFVGLSQAMRPFPQPPLPRISWDCVWDEKAKIPFQEKADTAVVVVDVSRTLRT